MGLNETPSGERVHIGFFGRRNAGKSSLVNAVTGQELAVVSDTRGTTTDPVSKAMELLPIGPVVIIDTPGFDDEGALGELRVRKTRQILNKSDVAVLVADCTEGLKDCDRELIEIFRQKEIPWLLVWNKCDLKPEHPEAKENEIYVSATEKIEIEALKEKIAGMRVDADVVKGIDLQDNDHFAMTVGGKLYTDKKEAGVALISAASGLKSVKSAGQIGEYHGFALSSEYNFLSNTYTLTIKGKCSYKIEFGKDTLGNIQRIHNALSAIEKKLADTEQNLETVQQQLKTAQEEVQKPFPKEAELSEKMERLAELNAMLNMDEKGGENLLADEGIGENPEVNVTEERQDRIADSVHKTSILERLKEQKQQEQTGEIQQKPKKKHEQEL
mgnify:FL=1